jgi:hypothetical protein
MDDLTFMAQGFFRVTRPKIGYIFFKGTQPRLISWVGILGVFIPFIAGVIYMDTVSAAEFISFSRSIPNIK